MFHPSGLAVPPICTSTPRRSASPGGVLGILVFFQHKPDMEIFEDLHAELLVRLGRLLRPQIGVPARENLAGARPDVVDAVQLLERLATCDGPAPLAELKTKEAEEAEGQAVDHVEKAALHLARSLPMLPD